MKFPYVLPVAIFILALSSICGAQDDPKLEKATVAVLRAFDTHDIVMLGEIERNKQEYEWLRSLVAAPEFADRVDDIVMEFGNSLYQKSVDRYVSGEKVPIELVQKAWLNMGGVIGPPSPVYGSLYRAVRETNLKRRGKHQIRILCGDPYIDWEKVKNNEDIAPYLSNREQWYAQVVKDEVVAKHHRALLIMGSGHFLRGLPRPASVPAIEPQLRLAGAQTYLIVVGTNATGGYDDLDRRFDSWPAPVIVSLVDGWVGELPAIPVIGGGASPIIIRPAGGPAQPPALKLKDGADAMLYLGPRDSLIAVNMPRTQLVGTPYGREVERRLRLEGFPSDFISQLESRSDEAPQFPRPKPSGASRPLLPPPPRNLGAALPPRPASQ